MFETDGSIHLIKTDTNLYVYFAFRLRGSTNLIRYSTDESQRNGANAASISGHMVLLY